MNAYERIKVRLTLAGSNVSELCRRAGISRNAAERWKNKPDSISPETLAKIIPALEAIEQNHKVKNTKSRNEQKSELLSRL